MKYVTKDMENGEFAAGHYFLDTPVFIADIGGCRTLASAERAAAELTAAFEAREEELKANQVARGVVPKEAHEISHPAIIWPRA